MGVLVSVVVFNARPALPVWVVLGSGLLAVGGWLALIFGVQLFLAPARIDSDSQTEIRRLKSEVATLQGPKKLPPGEFQTRVDRLLQLVLKYQREHAGERRIRLEYLLPAADEWADYVDVLQAWEAQRGVRIVSTDSSTGYPNVKFVVPKGFQ